MEGHIHLGLAHTIGFAATLVVVLALFRLFEYWGASSGIPLIEKLAGALAVIV
jgi:hypothetical protein